MKSVLVSALLISIIAGASALECYSCLAGTDCGDPFSTSGKATCNSLSVAPGLSSTSLVAPAVSCLKTVAGDTVIRACSPAACASKSACTGGTCIYCCDSDRCNGGNTVTTSFVAMGVALVAAFIFSRQ